jgi:hypothetical protein
MTLAQLMLHREALQTSLFQGVLIVRTGDKQVTYKSNKEMRGALADLDKEIAHLEGKSPCKRILPYAVKGL